MANDSRPFESPGRVTALAIVGMGCIGVGSLLGEGLSHISLRDIWREVDLSVVGLGRVVLGILGMAFWLICPFLGGCLVGAMSLPIVLPALRGKQLPPLVNYIYGPAFLIVMTWSALTDFEYAPIDSAAVAWIVVCAAAMLLRNHLPDARRRWSPLCPECGYDLRGELAKGCPECGWNRRRP